MSQNGQLHFKNVAAFAPRFLKCALKGYIFQLIQFCILMKNFCCKKDVPNIFLILQFHKNYDEDLFCNVF